MNCRKVPIFDMYLFTTIVLLTLSSCKAVIGTKMESALLYVGYLFLLGGIYISYLRLNRKYRKRFIDKFVLILTVLFSVGILAQNLTIKRKLILLFTMLAILMTSTMAENFIKNYRNIRSMAYGCIWGVITSMIICLACGEPLWGEAVEGTLGIYWFFNGGIRDKNIATIMLAMIISLYIYDKHYGEFRQLDRVMIVIGFLFILLSNSRGAWIHTFVFFVMMNCEKLYIIRKNQRKLFAVCITIAGLIMAYFLFNKVILQSSTYLFRYRGLTNYLSMFGSDGYHMWLGNAEIAYDKDLDYVNTIRSITGWNGSLEIAWLNILIKNGLLGVIGFIIIFFRFFNVALKSDNVLNQAFCISLTVMLIVTSLVATYIQTVHSLFGIYCYLLISFFIGMEHKKLFEENWGLVNNHVDL